MTDQSKWEYLKAIHARYRAASRTLKQRILDEFCEVTRYQRKYALRLLNGPPPGRRPPLRRRQRALHYGSRVIQILVNINNRGCEKEPLRILSEAKHLIDIELLRSAQGIVRLTGQPLMTSG